jgi:hypothetical protein
MTREHELALPGCTSEPLMARLKGRLNVHESAIVTILQRVMDIIDPPAMPDPPRRRIGFRNG